MTSKELKEGIDFLFNEVYRTQSKLDDVIKAISALNEKDAVLVIKARLMGFYGTMYGGVGQEVIHISRNLEVWGNGNLIFTWGFPGPDYNVYKPEDYGKTWALTEEELDGES